MSVGLEMNTKKTQCMYFNKSGKMCSERFYVNGCEIDQVKEYKYLGLTVSSNGSFVRAKENLYKVACKAMYGVKRCLDLNVVNIKSALHIFDTLVEPILLYGCEVTNPMNITEKILEKPESLFDRILEWEQEKLHINFCRYLLGVNNKTSKVSVLSELGRYPLFIKATKQILKYYERCEKLGQDSLVQQAYREMKTKKNSMWLKFVDFIANTLNVNINGWCVEKMCAELQCLYKDYWKNTLFNDVRENGQGNKMRTYRKFKSVYSMEPYLCTIKNVKHRRSLSKFRLSNHNLGIEIGRHNRIKLEERLCDKCKVIDDEVHFFANCNKHTSQRTKLFDVIIKQCANFVNLNDEGKLIYAMTAENNNMMVKVGDFVHNCLYPNQKTQNLVENVEN